MPTTPRCWPMPRRAIAMRCEVSSTPPARSSTGFVFARVGGNQAVAEDLVQDTYLGAVRSAASDNGMEWVPDRTWLTYPWRGCWPSWPPAATCRSSEETARWSPGPPSSEVPDGPRTTASRLGQVADSAAPPSDVDGGGRRRLPAARLAAGLAALAATSALAARRLHQARR